MRDAAEYTEASTTPDMAESCDSRADIIAEVIAEVIPGTAAQVRKATEFYIKVSERLANIGQENISSKTKKTVMHLARSVLTTCLFPRPNHIRAVAASYALDLGLHGTKSMTEMARLLGISRAAISVEAWKILRINNLPPSRWMRSEETTKMSRKAREKVLAKKTK